MKNQSRISHIVSGFFLLLLSLASFFSLEVGLCQVGHPTCINTYSLIASQALFLGLALLIVSPILKRWTGFAVWYIPLTILVFVFYHPSPYDLALPSEEVVALILSVIYILVSYLLILKKKLLN